MDRQSTIYNYFNFLNKNGIDIVDNHASCENISDLSSDNSLKLVRINNNLYFALEIEKVANERVYNKFFSILDNKFVQTNSQCKIEAFKRNKNNPCFLIKKNENDCLLKEFMEDECISVQERVNLCKKVVILICDLFYQMKTIDDKANLFGLCTDSFIYNKDSKTLKVIYYGFESALVESGYPVDELKRRVLNYCPKEIIMSVFARINGEKLSTYIVGAILLEILSGIVPWQEKNYDAVKNFITVGSETVYLNVQSEFEEFIRNNLGNSGESECNSLIFQISQIIELSTEPDAEKRTLTLTELKEKVTKLLSDSDLVGCDLCEQVREKANYYCTETSHFYCEICRKKYKSQSNFEFISIDEFRINKYDKQLVTSFNCVKNLALKNFSDINNEIRRNKEEMTSRKKRMIEKTVEDLYSYIEKLNDFKNKFQEESLKRLEVENQFYDDILLVNQNAENYKTELTNKYRESLESIKNMDNDVEKDYRLLRKNYFTAREIEEKLMKFQNEVFSNYYGGYEAIHILFNDINNHFSDFTSKIGSFFEKTFTSNLQNFDSGFNVNHNNTLDEYKNNYLYYVKDDNFEESQNDEKTIEHHQKLYSTIVRADMITLNEEAVKQNIKNRSQNN